MARNYSMAEAVRIVREGTDKAALIDLGKKFPMVMYHLTKLDGNGMDFVSMLPAKITTRKMESILRGGVEVDDEVETEVDNEEEVTEPKAAKSTEAPAPKPWKSMSQYQKTKARALGAEYVAACKKLDEAGNDEEEDQPAEKPAKREKRTKKAKETLKAEVEDDDEDEEDEEPVKKPAKKAKKAAKKVVEEDEDDDDFDFDFDDDDE